MTTRLENATQVGIQTEAVPSDETLNDEEAVYVVEDRDAYIEVENHFIPGDDFEVSRDVLLNASIHAKEDPYAIKIRSGDKDDRTSKENSLTLRLRRVLDEDISKKMGRISESALEISQFGMRSGTEALLIVAENRGLRLDGRSYFRLKLAKTPKTLPVSK